MCLSRHLRPPNKLNQERSDLPKTQKTPKTSRRQNGDMKEVWYWGPTNIRRHCDKIVGMATWRWDLRIPEYIFFISQICCVYT